MQYSDALEDSAENDMPDQDFIQTVRLNEIFMPAASRERRDMFARQGLEFSPHALGVQFALSLPNNRFLRFGASFVSMMQSAKDGQGHDFADAMYRSSVRGVFF